MSEEDPAGLFSGRRGRRAKQANDQLGEAPQLILTPEEKDRLAAVASVERHLADMQTHANVTISRIDELEFVWTITPQQGFWTGGVFEFKITIPNNFPYSSPSAVLTTPIWHPNIDLDGKPCVSVLQKGWRPTYTLSYVMYGLLYLFESPNSEDPLNTQAAGEMRTDLTRFKKHVREKMDEALKTRTTNANKMRPRWEIIFYIISFPSHNPSATLQYNAVI